MPDALASLSPSPQVLPRRVPLLGTGVSICDYGSVATAVLEAAREGRFLGVAALSAHPVTHAALHPAFRAVLNRLDVCTPDGQPVRWAMNLIHRAGLRERVYGPALMLRICEAAAREGLPIYLHGSIETTLRQLANNLRATFPGLRVAAWYAPPFREASDAELDRAAQAIRASGARIVFVGLGSPRQEAWIDRVRGRLDSPCLAVGAAFDFIAGTVPQAPAWMQRRGLEWLFRLWQEPRRLWRRYLVYNPLYAALVAAQACGWNVEDGTWKREGE